MGKASKPRLALVRPCAVCEVARRDMLAVPAGAVLCRPCAARVGAFVRGAGEDWLETAWSRDAPSLPSCAGRPERADLEPFDREKQYALIADWLRSTPAEDDLFARLEHGVALTLLPDDFRARYDLAAAYHEMGLAYDVLRQVAFILSENASMEWAQSVLSWMFDPRHARPDAFARIVSALRAS